MPSEKTETYRYIERIGGFHEMELNYIDIGCNLMGKQFKNDRDQVVEQSLADGVAGNIYGIPAECTRITRTAGTWKDVRS